MLFIYLVNMYLQKYSIFILVRIYHTELFINCKKKYITHNPQPLHLLLPATPNAHWTPTEHLLHQQHSDYLHISIPFISMIQRISAFRLHHVYEILNGKVDLIN